MVWRMATPSTEDRQKPDSTPYTWSDYVHKLISIILARHGCADHIICVNDPYDAANSTKDDERDLRAQGKAHIPNTYMKLDDPFPSARALTTLLCSVSNKGRLQKLICSYLNDIAQTVDAEIVYSVGSHCTNLSTSAFTSLRQTLSSSPLTQCCESQAIVDQLSLILLILMPMSQQRLSQSNCLVCSTSRESRRR